MNGKPSNNSREKPPLKVRFLALEILNQLDSPYRTLDQLMEETLASSQLDAKRDRALLTALSFGVCRWRRRLDYIIAHFSRTPLARIDPPVLNALRLGLFQLTYLNRIPPSAAVDTTVEIVKGIAPQWVVRYANAVLRRAAADWRRVALPDPASDPTAAIAVRKSFPEWLVRRWLRRYGTDATIRRCDLLNQIPPVTVRTNTLRTSRPALIAALAEEAYVVEPAAIAPEAIRLGAARRAVHEMDAFRQGWFQVQDEAAQLVTLLLPLQPGQSVLDACCGLGGKTGHIAQILQNRGSIVAADTNASRLERLGRQMRRMGFDTVRTVACDLTDKAAADILGRYWMHPAADLGCCGAIRMRSGE